MPDPVSLILLVAAGEASTGQTRALVQAAREALVHAAVQTLETREALGDASALVVERAARAAAVVELTWSDPAHRAARIRVHLAASQRWVERSFAFGPGDPPSEQGRTIGFTVATMLPSFGHGVGGDEQPAGARDSAKRGTEDAGPADGSGPGAAASGAPPVPSPSGVASSDAGPGSAVASVGAAGPGDARSESSEGRDTVPLASGTGRVPTSGLALQLLGAAASGEAGGFGAEGALEWFPVPLLGARIAGAAQSGTVDAAHATSLFCGGAIGARLRPWPATPGRPIEVQVGADYLLSHLSLTHFDDDEPAPVTMGRWLSGVDLRIDLTWRLAGAFDLLVSAAVEDDFVATHVADKGVQVAILPPIRGLGLGGVQVRF